MILVWGVRLLLEHTWGISIHQVVQQVLSDPLHYLGGTFSGALISALLMGLLWSIGIHGDAVVGSVMAPIFLSLTLQNQDAKLADTAIPNTVCNQFFDLFLNIGGTGTTLSLTLLLLFFCPVPPVEKFGAHRHCARAVQYQRTHHLRPAHRDEPAVDHSLHTGSHRDYHPHLYDDGVGMGTASLCTGALDNTDRIRRLVGDRKLEGSDTSAGQHDSGRTDLLSVFPFVGSQKMGGRKKREKP